MNRQFLEKKLLLLINEKQDIEKKIENNNDPVTEMSICIIGALMSLVIMPLSKSLLGVLVSMLMMISFSCSVLWIKSKIDTSKKKLIQLKEEIEKQLSNPNIQREVITNVNVLLSKYPNNENIAENARELKNALINKEYNPASFYLSRLIKIIKNESDLELYEQNKNKEQKNIDKYEKEIGVKILSNQEVNDKEIEKGWSRIL